MKIVVDALGGDSNCPEVNVEGALLALNDFSDIEIVLIGPEEEIKNEISKNKKILHDNAFLKKISIVNTNEYIRMDEQPSKILRTKENSSIALGIKFLKDNLADAFVSSGNSGAILAFAVTQIKKYADRPAIATVLPTIKNPCVLIDVGANVDCKPRHLVEFAYMGYVYCKNILKIENPKVGILSIGTEETKGNNQTLEAYQLLKNTSLNFIGNIEGRDIPFGVADVVVTDGFVGNVVLKLGEGIAEVLLELIRDSLKKHPLAWFSLPFVWNAIKDLRKKVDFSEYGGAPLLGLEKVCIICHGRSNAKAIKNAIKVAKQMIEKDINFIISQQINKGTNEKN
ncbi:MAG: phosphate acyltransferase PlsX [Endomicrobiia bacterium]